MDGDARVVLSTPWHWRPDRTPWLHQLGEAAATWTPLVATSLPASVVRSAIEDAATGGADWLYHPCLSAVTHRHGEGRQERELALLGWLAAHGAVEGDVALEHPTWCWSATGGIPLDRGIHDLGAVGAAMVAGDGAPDVAFDPWCTLLGYVHPDSVPAGRKPDADQQESVRQSALVGLRALGLLRAVLPEIADWLASHVKLLVFLDGDGSVSRSSSAADLPAVVFADAVSELALLEVLVHEAAHHALYLEEARGPLVDPTDARLFTSPLRPDPRPLRGILLAAHALSCICAFYADVQRAWGDEEVADAADLASLRMKAREALDTLDAARDGLTDDGLAFVSACERVVCGAD